jgi:AcrR family transcriptional regulator
VSAAQVRRPGRPRSDDAHRAIIAATLSLLGRHGVAGLTMEGVAAAAGVGKTTVYRRWPSKTALALEALSELAPPDDPPETGSLQGDLRALTDLQRRRLAGSELPRVVPRVLGEAADDPELQAGFFEHVITPLRRIIRTLLERAIERGEVSPDADVEALVDILHAIPVYKVLTAGGDVEAVADVPDRYLPILLAGISSSSAGPASARRRSSGSSRAKPARSA